MGVSNFMAHWYPKDPRAQRCDIDRSHHPRKSLRAARDDDWTKRVERVERAVRSASDMRLPTRDFKFAPWLRGDPDVAAVLRVEGSCNSLEGVRILAGVDRLPIRVHPQRLEIATPRPAGAEWIGAARMG